MTKKSVNLKMATPPYDLKRPTSYAPAIPAGPTPELRRPTKSRTWILFSSFFFISLILLVIYQSSTTNNPIISPNEVSANVDQSSPAENLTPPPAEVSIGEGGLRFAWTDAMLSWQRTAYHFQPEKNWMNDPNGPLLYKGWYHSFYQYNRDSAVWGNLTWGHAVSRDLIHWLHLPIALVPDQLYDISGVWTGSATILSNGQIVMLYTGLKDGVQVQCVAYPANSSDPLLLEWVKDPHNPVIAPPPGIGDDDFRDPTTAWLSPDGDNWFITIGSKINKTGISIVYETNDFISYKLLEGFLHEVPGTGMWECIDFYPVSLTGADGLDTSANGIGIKHVLKVSLQDQFVDCYALGTYDPINNKWTPKDPKFDLGTALRYDYGRYYASKTFYDNDKKRRILLAWIKESNGEELDILKGWSGVQSIPRTVVYDQKTGDNILLQWPVKEVESLRSESFELSDVKLGPGSVVPLKIESTSQLDIFATFEIDKQESLSIAEEDSDYDCPTSGGAANRGTLGPFGILVLADENLSELTPVYFYLGKGANGKAETHFCVDELRSSEASDVEKVVYGSNVPVLDGERLTIRSLIDHSIVESFAQGGRTVITSRVYPTKSINEGARVLLFNNATGASVTASVKAWKMESADIHPFPLDQL